MSIDDLVVEINQRVDEKHDEIIATFLERIKRPRPCSCNFDLRSGAFYSALSHYKQLRKRIHRIYQAGYKGQYGYVYLAREVAIARNRLVEVAPCHECIARLNPTGRDEGKPPWNPRRRRAWKEMLT